MHEIRRSRLLAYGVALPALALGFLARWQFDSLLGQRALYSTFFPAVMIAAYFGGLWPGLLVTLAAVFVADAVAEPHLTLALRGPGDTLAMVLFVLTGAIISALCESLHRARRRIMAEERRTELARRETEERFGQLVENIQEIFWMSDSRFERVLFVSPVYEQIYGRPFKDLAGSIESVHPDDLAAVAENMEQARRGTFKYIEYRIVRPDGSIRWLRSRAFPVHDAEENLSRIAGLTADVTARKRAEEELRLAKDRLELAVRASNLAIWEFDMPDGRIENSRQTLINLWETLGHDPATAPADFTSTFALGVHPDDQERMRREMQEFLASDRREFGAEYRVPSKDGLDYWRLARGVALRDQDGKPFRFIGSLVEITDLKRAEEALRKSEQRFRMFVDHATDAFFLFDEQFVVLDVNRQACDSLGYCREELIGMTPIDFDPDVTPERLDEIKRSLDIGELLAFESRHRRKDGTVFPVEVRGQAFWEGGRRLTVSMARDHTERKKIEVALRESEELFRGTFENASIGIANVDFQGRWLRVNQRLCDIVGYTREEMLQKTFQEITYPDDMSISLEYFIPLKQGDLASFSLQKRYIRKDGSPVWVELFESLQRDATGKPAYCIVMIQDISERKRLEVELRESESRWRSLTEALPQLVWTATPDGACDYFSTQWTQYTGIPESDLSGWRWLQVLHPDDREATRLAWTAAVQGPGVYDVEYRVRRFDGEYRWFKTRGVPIRDSKGGVFKWFGTCTDITDAKMAAEELRLAKEAAESANRAKDEFLANVSHEIRTPMNAILGLTTLVLGTRLDDSQRQSLTTVKSAGNILLGIINDLLDFSKIEAGKLQLDRGDFSLRTALGDTLRALAIRAHQKGLELASNVLPDVPDALIGDAGRLRQVLLNIIGNAIKFTEKGEVVVQAGRVPDAPDAPSTKDEVELLFTVRDTGIGIPREKHAAIFRPFEQEDSSTTRKYGGTGLGLTIAAQLAGLMGGRITLDSEPGRGSTFSITARFGQSAKREAMVTPNGSADLLENLRVLIVDDNLTNRQILEEWLHNWRMRPVAVGDGAAAADALRRAGEIGTPYSLVLLDGRMPDMDGLAFVEQVRERLGATPIILLTSDDTTINTSRWRETGISAHLVKPVQQSELLETIRHVMSHTTADVSPTAAGSTPEPALPAPATPLRILVAEDNDLNVTLLKQLFARKGHRARIAGDGREALALATSDTFDVLLLDIHLPEMDGFAVAQAIREQERGSGKHVPIIAFTARSGKQDREKCLAAGMDDFLSKPVQAEALWAAIDRVAVAHRLRQGLIDPRVLLSACGGDDATLKSICATLRDKLPDYLAAVQTALLNHDAAVLREAAHKLLGMVSPFSTKAATVASDIEDLAACGDLEKAATLIEQLNTIGRQLPGIVGGLTIENLRHEAGND